MFFVSPRDLGADAVAPTESLAPGPPISPSPGPPVSRSPHLLVEELGEASARQCFSFHREIWARMLSPLQSLALQVPPSARRPVAPSPRRPVSPTSGPLRIKGEKKFFVKD
uniref:Uncharacterized protein n=1 Tax=Planktothricoides sp. SpSt-374 TaxID=2282167 RepID=A0A7C3ZW33_9CYAN